MVSEIRENMSIDELHEWGAWFQLKHEAEQRAIEQSKKANRGR